MNTVSDNISDELPYLWRFALRLTRSSTLAEDLVQKTAVRALERSHQFLTGSRLRSWLFSIMHSVWKNELRADAIRKNSTLDLNEFENLGSTNCTGETNQLFREVMQQVYGLPEAQRLVVLLICVEGYSYQETADILDIAIGTVMSRLARARLVIGKSFIEKDICVFSRRRNNYEGR